MGPIAKRWLLLWPDLKMTAASMAQFENDTCIDGANLKMKAASMGPSQNRGLRLGNRPTKHVKDFPGKESRVQLGHSYRDSFKEVIGFSHF
jgi:hypothetical protein